jgi:hypothetical protein
MAEPVMPLPAMAQAPTSLPPAVLLANHLKALKLPTFVREYEKVAFEAAQDRAIILATCCGYANSSGSTANAGWSNGVSAWPGSRTPKLRHL